MADEPSAATTAQSQRPPTPPPRSEEWVVARPFDYDTNPATVKAHAEGRLGKVGQPSYRDQKPKKVEPGESIQLSVLPAQSLDWLKRGWLILPKDQYQRAARIAEEAGMDVGDFLFTLDTLANERARAEGARPTLAVLLGDLDKDHKHWESLVQTAGFLAGPGAIAKALAPPTPNMASAVIGQKEVEHGRA